MAWIKREFVEKTQKKILMKTGLDYRYPNGNPSNRRLYFNSWLLRKRYVLVKSLYVKALRFYTFSDF